MDGCAISFGPFRLLAARRLLLEGDNPVRLGSRAFDILTALVERAGQVVGKAELIARAWPQTFVEEANLKIQVSALRRALGDGQDSHRYVVTVPGRGYNFVAPVSFEVLPRTPLIAAIAPTGTLHNLPLAVTRMIGREQEAEALLSRLSRERLVTIVGPGGIGKTTLALAVAERTIAGYEQGVWLVDLAPLADPRLVPSVVGTMVGLEIRTEDPLPALVAGLREKRMLLLLDNCEHVIDAAATLAAKVLSGAPAVDILATSREPLRVAGEREYRLGSLGHPQPSPTMTAAEAATFPAVQLFAERVTAIVEDFSLTDANAPAVAEICRRLDGLPLAIEFAAPRVAVLGVEGLAARLGDSLQPLAARRRSAVPRHATMRAVIDWSYGLLSEDEQLFFRALGIFVGGFTVEAAAAVASDAANASINAIERLADLVAKSLVVADVSGANPRFRLLDTTRAYAIEKLHESREREALAPRHAEYYRSVFQRALGESATRSTGEWLADYAQDIDNLRTALDWAFSPAGDGSIGVALTAAAVPLWMRLSLLIECRGRARQALKALGATKTGDAPQRMRLYSVLGASTPEAPEMGAAFTKALRIAERIGDLEYQLRALGGLYFFSAACGRHFAAFPFAQRFHDLATSGSDPGAQLFGEHILGVAKHFLGNQISARSHLEKVLIHYARTDRGQDAIRFQNVIRFQIDAHVSTCAFLARVLWLQGFPDQAVRTVEMTIEKAQATGHALSLCFALALAACPIALWVGNLAAAADYTGMLRDSSRKHGLSLWSAFGARFERIVALKGDDRDTGLHLRRANLDNIVESSSSFWALTGLTELVEGLARAGQVAEGLAVVQTGLEHSEVGWNTPEVLRLKGELLLLQRTSVVAKKAEDLFRQALEGARRQEALSWELRAATSLASLLRRQGRATDARVVLQPVYSRFAEGLDTDDLVRAKRLLDALSNMNATEPRVTADCEQRSAAPAQPVHRGSTSPRTQTILPVHPAFSY